MPPLRSLITLVALMVIGGCTRHPAASVAPTSQPTAASTSQTSEPQVSNDTLLDSAVQLLQATKRSPTAHQIAAQRLNQYLAKARASGESPVHPLGAELKAALTGRLSPQQIQMIEMEQFDRPDAIHLEDCFLLRDAARQATAGKRDEMSKTLAVFDWVVRNIQLTRLQDAASVPMAPRMTLLLGRGTEAERAWTFMELLRQVDIDSVLLATIEKAPDGKQVRL